MTVPTGWTTPARSTTLRPSSVPEVPPSGGRVAPPAPPARRWVAALGPWTHRAQEPAGLVRQAAGRWADLAAPLLGRVRAVLGCVSGFGWLMFGCATASWLLAERFGWVELRHAAFVLLGLFSLACLLTIGRTSLRVQLRLEPVRVVAGERAALQVSVTNVGRRSLLPMPLDVPAVRNTVRFALPSLGAGAAFEDIVVLPAQARGVYPVGPASTLRGDPFGLVRRQIVWTEPIDFFVHPPTVYLDALGRGLLRDIEGRSTNDVSVSDLAFHALRQYAPGDDRRHIHWPSTAKRSATSGRCEFMVRQFLDTRRSHLGIVLDCDRDVWRDEAEFETAVSVAASVAVRALRDEMELTQAVGPLVQARPQKHSALDLYSRAGLGEEPVGTSCARLARTSSGVSSVVLVTGPRRELVQLSHAKAVFGPDVQVIVVQVEHGAEMTLRRSSGLLVITIEALGDLPLALAGQTVS
jgi:uncharacterized protein (DUF58 family)